MTAIKGFRERFEIGGGGGGEAIATIVPIMFFFIFYPCAYWSKTLDKPFG
jgi:hypothetical protein